MKHDTETTAVAVHNALHYLASRKALHKLDKPCPIVGRDICLWLPHRQTTLTPVKPKYGNNSHENR